MRARTRFVQITRLVVVNDKNKNPIRRLEKKSLKIESGERDRIITPFSRTLGRRYIYIEIGRFWTINVFTGDYPSETPSLVSGARRWRGTGHVLTATFVVRAERNTTPFTPDNRRFGRRLNVSSS